MITFDELKLGEEVVVSDGTPKPAEPEAINVWNSRNFKGVVSEVTADTASFEVDKGSHIITWTLTREPTFTLVPTKPSDEVLNRFYEEKIEEQAAILRKELIPDAGQEAIYKMKEAEAKAWTPKSKKKDYPLLSTEADIRGISLEEMVQLVLTASDNWTNLAKKIEIARISAKTAVSKAKSQEAKDKASQLSI